ncbi:hypothetical protein G6F22_021584 [Rhizopus arrhizus]|nr:hypothetical protein G6F22_021584 [Rhizopus arrhizus]KAG1238293.1 hypothetical protein G6F68_018769 [Rhizopus microsporus]
MLMRSALIGSADGVKLASTEISGSRKAPAPLFLIAYWNSGLSLAVAGTLVCGASKWPMPSQTFFTGLRNTGLTVPAKVDAPDTEMKSLLWPPKSRSGR